MNRHETYETPVMLPEQRQPGGDIITILQQIRDAVVQPPRRSATEGLDEWLVREVIVTTASLPQRGPDIAIPRGYTLVVRLRNHSGSNPTGYIGPNQAAVLNQGSRVHLSEGDALELKVSNMNKVWFNSDTNSTEFELIVEM